MGGGRGGRLRQGARGAAVSGEHCVGGDAGMLSSCRSRIFRFQLSLGIPFCCRALEGQTSVKAPISLGSWTFWALVLQDEMHPGLIQALGVCSPTSSHTVQLLFSRSVLSDCPWTAACQVPPGDSVWREDSIILIIS